MARLPRVALILALSLVLVALAPARADGDDGAEDEDAVLTLTTATFDDALTRHNRMLVEFYAPWCGHCKQLDPEYKQAASEMKQERLETVLAKVDATLEPEVAKRYGVSGYPTLKYFVKGQSEPKDFEGERTASGLKAWLKKRELPVVVTMDGEKAATYVAAAEKFVSGAGPLPEGTPNDGFRLVAKVVKKSARAKAYLEAVQSQLADWEVVSLTSQVIYMPKATDPKGPETSLMLWRPGFEEPDSKMLAYTGKWTDAAISKWVKSSVYPTVGTQLDSKLYSISAAEDMGKDGTVVVVLDDGAEDEEDLVRLRPSVLNELLPLAAAEPRWLFTAVSLDSLKPAHHEILGIAARSLSTAVVLQGKSKYHLGEKGDSAVTKPGALRELLENVKSKTAKPFYKSAAVPDPEVDSDGVTTLVGDTFDKYVMDPKKDVFVEFYAPWCGHCKKLDPIWSEIARTSKDQGWAARGVVIAKMDATENGCSEEVTGYPKMVMYPAVKADKKFRQKADYSGAREYEPLVDFILGAAKSLDGAELGIDKKKGGRSMVDRELAKKGKAKEGKGTEL